MSRPYLYRDLLEKGRVLSCVDGHRLLCDGHNHYHLFPNHDIQPKAGCDCTVLKGDTQTGPVRLNYPTLARPRYEVYNKDADFFHDHLNGGMIWLKQSSRPDTDTTSAIYWIEQLVEQILTLLNREEHATLLLQNRPRQAAEGTAR